MQLHLAYRQDSHVRASHREREGQVFDWNNPPVGGNAGEDFGCRCTAEPSIPAESEFSGGALCEKLERIAFDQVHLITGDTQHNQRLSCLGSPSI